MLNPVQKNIDNAARLDQLNTPLNTRHPLMSIKIYQNRDNLSRPGSVRNKYTCDKYSFNKINQS